MVSMGGHLVLLQTIAWGSMIFSYSDKAPFSEAVEKTFDGEHPCELCKLVKETKREEEKKPVTLAMKKQDVVLASMIMAPVPRGTDLVPASTPYERWAPEECAEVLLRPPRLL